MALARRELPTVCGDEQISGGGGDRADDCHLGLALYGIFHRRGEIDFAVWFHLRSYDLPFGAKRTAVAVLAPNWRAAARCESPLHHASAMD